MVIQVDTDGNTLETFDLQGRCSITEDSALLCADISDIDGYFTRKKKTFKETTT